MSRGGNASVVKIDASTTTVEISPFNGRRAGLILYNRSSSVLWVKFGPDAAADSISFSLDAGSMWEMPLPIITSAMTGFWESADGEVFVTEISG